MRSLTHRLRQSRVLRACVAPLLAKRRQLANPGRLYEVQVWERLHALLSEDPVVRVAEFNGTFQLDARSHVFQRILLEGQYEPELARLCLELAPADRDVIDVGANAGFFSVLLARHLNQCRVLSIEPSGTMASRLRANVERNGVGDIVDIFEGAASDHPGEVTLTGIDGREEYGTIGALAHPAVRNDETATTQAQRIEARTLDSLVSDFALSPGFIKIDVEGAEHLVFRGATDILHTHRPIVLSEMNDGLLRANGSSAKEVLQEIKGAGYRVLNPFVEGHPDAKIEDLETPHMLEEILCLPEEHHSE